MKCKDLTNKEELEVNKIIERLMELYYYGDDYIPCDFVMTYNDFKIKYSISIDTIVNYIDEKYFSFVADLYCDFYEKKYTVPTILNYAFETREQTILTYEIIDFINEEKDLRK